MQYGNGINPCSGSYLESMAAVLSWWMYIKDVMRMLLRVLSIGWGMTGTRSKHWKNRVIIWSRVFIRMIVPYWKTCKSGWGSSFITSLWNIGMTLVMYIVFVYSMLVVTMCV